MTVIAMAQAKSASTMSEVELTLAVAQYRKLKAAADKAAAALESTAQMLKAEMESRGVETLIGGDFKITYKTIVSNRVDTTALKRELPDIAARYSKATTSKRFTLS